MRRNDTACGVVHKAEVSCHHSKHSVGFLVQGTCPEANKQKLSRELAGISVLSRSTKRSNLTGRVGWEFCKWSLLVSPTYLDFFLSLNE